MYGLRDYKLFKIPYRRHLQVRSSDGGGGTDFVGWEEGWTEDSESIVATSKELAEVWFQKRHKYSMAPESKADLQYDRDKITEERIDTFLLEFTF